MIEEIKEIIKKSAILGGLYLGAESAIYNIKLSI